MKVYAVAKGKHPGIYFTWDQCKAETHKVKGSIFKSFDSIAAAEDFYKQHNHGQLPKNKNYRNPQTPKIEQANATYRKIEDCILCGKPMQVRRRKRGPSHFDEGICANCRKRIQKLHQLNPKSQRMEPYTPDEIVWVLYYFPCENVKLFLQQNPDIGMRARMETHDGFMRTYIKRRNEHRSISYTSTECPQ